MVRYSVRGLVNSIYIHNLINKLLHCLFLCDTIGVHQSKGA